MHPQSAVRKAVRFIRLLAGQRNFYRAARLLMYEARFDVPNDPASNGELYLQSAVLRHVPKAIVFDVGANIGDWTASLLKQCHTDAAVHAFEPSFKTFDVLQRRAADWKSVTLVQMACSDRIGKSKFIELGATFGTNSLVSRESHPANNVATETVTLTTIDAYCRENNIPRINLLKVDTEGHDLAVLFGTVDMLRSRSVDVVQFEYNHRWIEERRLLRDAFDYLKPLGYAIGKLTGNAVQFYPDWHWELETYREANYIACVPDWVRLLRTVSPEWVPY